MIVDPPSLKGASQETAIEPLPETPVTFLGGPGTVVTNGVALDDETAEAPVPTVFFAATRAKYGVPLVRPVAVIDVAVEAVCVTAVHGPVFTLGDVSIT
jgi:hypothetical protein